MAYVVSDNVAKRLYL